jgi:hypothetical protein
MVGVKSRDKPMKKLTLITMSFLLVAITAGISSATVKGDGIWNTEQGTTVDRRKPRVKGGSGCDSPRDKVEHPACR